MNRIALTVATILAIALAAPAATAASFQVGIGTPVGGPEGGCSGGLGVTLALAPIAVTGQCASPGQLSGNAAALFGHVGAGSSVAGVPGYFGSGFGISAFGEFRDSVIFTSTDPNAFITTVATNLHVSGVLAADSFGAASVDVFFALAGYYALSAATNSGVVNSFQVVDGTVSAGTSNAHLRTGTGQVYLNQPVELVMRISSGAGAYGSGSAQSDFSNSFEIPFGMDVFVLPEGVTANAGTWLVNNRRVEVTATPVPEPSIGALMISGLAMLGFARPRRWGGNGS